MKLAHVCTEIAFLSYSEHPLAEFQVGSPSNQGLFFSNQREDFQGGLFLTRFPSWVMAEEA